jgi:hypothetical protein
MSAEKVSACTIQRTTAADAEDNDIQVQTTNNRYHVPHKCFPSREEPSEHIVSFCF